MERMSRSLMMRWKHSISMWMIYAINIKWIGRILRISIRKISTMSFRDLLSCCRCLNVLQNAKNLTYIDDNHCVHTHGGDGIFDVHVAETCTRIKCNRAERCSPFQKKHCRCGCSKLPLEVWSEPPLQMKRDKPSKDVRLKRDRMSGVREFLKLDGYVKKLRKRQRS